MGAAESGRNSLWQMMRVGCWATWPGCSQGLVRSRICFAYHGVFRYDQTITVTSCLIPSTSCRYHSGNVSLSPLVKRTPYGSTELSMLYAQSRAAYWPAREAYGQLRTRGRSAIAITGEAFRQPSVT